MGSQRGEGYMRDWARQLRRECTPAEEILWGVLRNRGLDGWKFRRQHPVGCFVLDFFCAELDLAVEVDGLHHSVGEQRRFDMKRDSILGEFGVNVLRLENCLVVQHVGDAIENIRQRVLTLTPGPSP